MPDTALETRGLVMMRSSDVKEQSGELLREVEAGNYVGITNGFSGEIRAVVVPLAKAPPEFFELLGDDAALIRDDVRARWSARNREMAHRRWHPEDGQIHD